MQKKERVVHKPQPGHVLCSPPSMLVTDTVLNYGDSELQCATTPSQFGRQVNENLCSYMGGVTHGYHMQDLFPGCNYGTFTMSVAKGGSTDYYLVALHSPAWKKKV